MRPIMLSVGGMALVLLVLGAQNVDVEEPETVLGQLSWGVTGVYTIVDLVPCTNGTAWAAAVGPGDLEGLRLFRIDDFDTFSPDVNQNKLINLFGYEYYYDADEALPNGIGPRGYPGMELNSTCDAAYLPNFYLGNVIKVDLEKGVAATRGGGVKPDDGTIVWPENFEADDTGALKGDLRIMDGPVDVQLNSPGETKVLVSSYASFEVLSALTGAVLGSIYGSRLPTGLGSVVTHGSWAIAFGSNGAACFELNDYRFAGRIDGLGNNPYMAVASSDGNWVYVSNPSSRSVSVLVGGSCAKSIVKTIDVGEAPRHLALSPDDRFLYVSNATENTVSVIDTKSLSVVTTIVVSVNEPAPIGVLAVSPSNRFLYVFWEGGRKSSAQEFRLLQYDVSRLY